MVNFFICKQWTSSHCRHAEYSFKIFAARRYASAVYGVVLCLSVRQSRRSIKSSTGCLTDQQIWLPVDFQEFPGDILTKINYPLQFLFEEVSKLNEEACGDRPHPTPIPISRWVSWHLPKLLTSISIDAGLLQDILYWYTLKYKNFSNINDKRTNSQTKPQNFQ